MRDIPAATRQLIESEEGLYQPIVLCELRHTSIGAEVIRIANSTSDVVSNGHTYVGFPFTLEMPDAAKNTRGRIAVQNVDREIGLFLQSLRSPPMIEIIIIVSTNLDTELMHIRRLWLRNIQGDTTQVSGDIDLWDFSTEPWPSRRINATDYPAVFW